MNKPRLIALVMIAASWAIATPGSATSILTGFTTSDLRVRAGPNGEQIDSIPAGTTVGVIGVTGSWGKILYVHPPGSHQVKTGWISLDYFQVGRGGIGGDACDTEYRTNAEVCVEVSHANLDCTKDRSSGFIRGCDVTVDYEVVTDYSGGAYLDVDVECNVAIQYQTKGSSYWRSDYMSDSSNHTLYAHDSDSESLYFGFHFGSYREVTRVQVESVDCEIAGTNVW